MNSPLLAVATAFLFPFVLVAQERQAPKKAPTLAESFEAARKAADEDRIGAAIASLQTAIKELQKKQRAGVLAALPKPDGWEIEDTPVDEASAELGVGLSGMGATVQRRYSKGEQSMNVEVTANSPVLQMMKAFFDNPALVRADGGEIVKYGAHKAILKKVGDGGYELTIMMHDANMVKVTSQGVSDTDLFKVFDQACVDRLEKPLGK